MTIQESGLSDTVLDLLAKCFERAPDEIKASFCVRNVNFVSTVCITPS